MLFSVYKKANKSLTHHVASLPLTWVQIFDFHFIFFNWDKHAHYKLLIIGWNSWASSLDFYYNHQIKTRLIYLEKKLR
jgi:hypothetical protein